jgi:starch-binding outer membrane protein, SusD/RagB family
MKKMKTKNIKYIIAILIVGFSFSCSKDWLEMDQKGAISQEVFYQTDEECLSALAAVYDMLQGAYAVDWESIWHIKTVVSDEANAGGSDIGDQSEYQDVNLYKHTPNNTKLYGIWRRLYYTVYRANVVIDKVEPNTPAKTIIVAEAKALRAYAYFEIVNLFGEAPLVTASVQEDYQVPKNTIAEIYAQIETDCSEAIPDLPLKSAILGTDNAWRIAKGFAQALLGKALLFQEKYADAATQLGAVISGDQYSLVANYDRVLRVENEYGAESLFELGYVQTEGHSWGNGTFPWGNDRAQENNIHWQLCGPRDFNLNTANPVMYGGWGHLPPTQSIYDLFDPTDPRRDLSVIDTADMRANYGNAQSVIPGGWQHEGKIKLKYAPWVDETDGAVQAELNNGSNFRVMRYAEVLLLAAEAYLQSDNTSQATIEFNKVRERAGFTQLSTITMDDIKYERTAELNFEGHRFYDLKRWGDAMTVLGPRGFEAKHVYFPIPQQDIDANPNLVQNPAW